MSILKYFTSNKTSTGKEDDAIFTSLESSGVSSKEYENIEETIKPAEKAKKKKKNYLQGGGQNENYKICQPLWYSKCSKTIQ